VLFKGYDGSILLATVDRLLKHQLGQPVSYPAHEGWTPIALTAAANGYTYVLSQTTEGAVSIWKLDNSLDLVKYMNPAQGPFSGWIPEGLTADTGGSSYLRLIWRNTNGQASIWCVDPDLNPCGSYVLGPYVGVAPER
jgi:hypothetical protein